MIFVVDPTTILSLAYLHSLASSPTIHPMKYGHHCYAMKDGAFVCWTRPIPRPYTTEIILLKYNLTLIV